MQPRSGRHTRISGIVAVIGASAAIAAFAAYRTHSESDSDLFFKTYPQVLGTKLDGCDTCHVRATALPPGQQSGEKVILCACDSCHVITDYGRRKGDTLTAFGRDYLENGRDEAALAAIEKADSDGDGASNAAEIGARTNPGDPQSAPDRKAAPSVMLSYDDIIRKGIPVRDQALFVNVSKSKDGDSYSDIRGFRLLDVLEAAGMAGGATSVDVISIDGYTATFSVDQLRRSYAQAAPVFGLGKETLGECGWVRYESAHLKEGTPLPPADILLAFEENGRRYEPARIDPQQRLTGAGPFRVVAPQMKRPGPPDLSSRATEACAQTVPEKHRYNRDYEKNSDYCVKAVVAIRVNPLPRGRIDIDWPQHATRAMDESGVVIFGNLKTAQR